MAENEAGVAVQTEEAEKEQGYSYPVTIIDIGPAAKKITVEIPRERISESLEKQYKELRQQASLPGFRVGHVPRKLLEKRFSDDVKDQVAATLVRESYQQVLEKNKLQVIGEPEFENQDAVKIPEQGPLEYSFQVEVQPDIKLPDFANLKVRKPRITITEQNIDQAMQNLREQQGTLIPAEGRGVESGDYLIADVHLKIDGNVINHAHDSQIVARAGRILGIQVDELDAKLAGLKPGETRTLTAHVPATQPNERLRDKDVEIEFSLKDIRKLELAEITAAFLEDLGFQNEQELRQALREQMDEKIAYDIQQAMREQVNRFLLENTPVQLPSKMSQKQTARVVNRRGNDLMMRGIPREQLEANIERLRAGAADEAIRELRLFFILQKIATDEAVDVSEAELNGRVAMLAAQRDRRPEKLKQEMQKDGSLADLYVQLRDQKAVDKLLEKAQIEEVEMTPQQGEEAAAPPEPIETPAASGETAASESAPASETPAASGENAPA